MGGFVLGNCMREWNNPNMLRIRHQLRVENTGFHEALLWYCNFKRLETMLETPITSLQIVAKKLILAYSFTPLHLNSSLILVFMPLKLMATQLHSLHSRNETHPHTLAIKDSGLVYQIVIKVSIEMIARSCNGAKDLSQV